MSRSPLSPAGKRLKTMDDTDETDDDEPTRLMHSIDDHSTSSGSRSEHYETRLSQNTNTSRTSTRYEWNPSSPSRELVRIVMERTIRRLRSDSPSRSDESNPDEVYRNAFADFGPINEVAGADEDIEQIYQLDRNSQHDSDNEELVFEDEDRDFMEGYDLNEDDDSDTDDDEEYALPDHDSEEDEIAVCSPTEYLRHDPTPNTQYPKPEWITVKELHCRRIGYSSSKTTKRTNMRWFEKCANNSLWMIQRLRCTDRLSEHSGCVDCLGFSSTGNLLCSGSDDLSVCIWDWRSRSKNSLKKKIVTNHFKNIYHSQFCKSDTKIITTSRDGTVRLIDVETNQSVLLLQQSGEIGKLTFTSPDVVITCGSNACVNMIDLRMREANKLFIVRSPKKNQTCALHTINSHPVDTQKIVVGGDSNYVFLYDLRRPVTRYPDPKEPKPYVCIEYTKNPQSIITSTAFNSTGDNLLVSFNDDDLVVYKTDTWDMLHRYKGHRNMKTIKGCAWFGDNFVLSGSDDGHIYGWDLNSEHIVCFLKGDDKGVVNCLCVHPELPILASSGLDEDVKLWEPTSETWPQTLTGIKPQICKNTMLRKRALVRQGLSYAQEDDRLPED